MIGIRRAWLILACLAGVNLLADPGQTQPVHGIAMYGEPALPPDFVSLPHADPAAPQGGRITFAEMGSLDSLNPYIRLGNAPWGVGLHTVESLMGRNHDEPFALYGLLAESVETDDSRSFVEFTLREEARFSDGSPVTVDDVMWSFQTMGTEGHARYRNAWSKIASMERTGPRSVRFTFTEPDRELPLILGLRPVLQAAQFDTEAGGRPFDASSMVPIIGSGPYVIDAVEAGRFVRFRRDPNWWGRDLPFNAGQHNIEVIRYDYFGDSNAAFEAFRAGLVDVWRERSAARWADSYDFPAVREGRVRLLEIPHSRPSGMNGFVFNTRRMLFADWRVREALITAFDFERINEMVNAGREPRISSYFGNSPLGMQPGPAEGQVRALLAPFADSLPPGALEGYALPVSDGTPSNRRNMRAAARLLADAGWEADARGVLRNGDGTAFAFDILLRQGANEVQVIATAWAEALAQLGIRARILVIDPAQYVERSYAYDFDVTHFTRLMSLSPGNEQRLYWGAEGAEVPGTRNLAGVRAPVVEAMIDTLLETDDPETFTAAVQALDRALMAGRYAVPLWYAPVSRLAVASHLHHPDRLPLYGDWTGFLPEVWWSEAPAR
ncbi:MAG: extracellular solute-binding protein [Pararhodobacter sp.]